MSCLNLWYPCRFVSDGESFRSAGQYVMAKKASTFRDEETRGKIMESDDPDEIFRLGDKVRNVREDLWNCFRSGVVKWANIYKFTQKSELKKYLLSTGNKILADASPCDTIMGIGLSADSHDACSPSHWRGENLLGFILMEVRELLRKEIREMKSCLEQASGMKISGNGAPVWLPDYEEMMPLKDTYADALSWTIFPMRQFETAPQNFRFNSFQMNIVRKGHIPERIEDQWFMYCDNCAIRYYRSLTGVCFAEALYEKCGDGYRITELRINSSPEECQYADADTDAAVALFDSLLVSEYYGFESLP